MSWTYRVGGLGVRSDLPLPCQDVRDCDPIDVDVVLRPALSEVEDGGPRRWIIDQDGARVSLGSGIGLLIQAPGRIVVSAATPDQRQLARAFLPGLAFAMLFLLRGAVSLHGGAVALGGRGFVFLGPSGAGKSTLTAAFAALDGAQALADDLTVPEWHDGRPALWPTFPGLRLLPDAAQALRVAGTQAADGKCWLEPPRRQPEAPVPLAGLFLLGERRAEQGDVRRLSVAEALPAVLREIKGKSSLAALPTRERVFAQASRLCRETPVYRIAAPPGLDRLGDFCRRLADLGGV